ncbi:MAG: hypothetical protein ACE5OS_10270 [Anaerolineae bacterium]
MVVIDTDVFILEFAFHHDSRHAVNADFLIAVRERGPAITVYNLMEILGQLSFNLSPDRLSQWRSWLQAAYGLAVIWPAVEAQRAVAFFRDEIYNRPLAKMQAQRMAFLDALIIGLAERAPDIEAFVTWNARHFRDKTPLTVLTPSEFLGNSFLIHSPTSDPPQE